MDQHEIDHAEVPQHQLRQRLRLEDAVREAQIALRAFDREDRDASDAAAREAERLLTAFNRAGGA